MEKLPPNADAAKPIDLEILEAVQEREFGFKWVRVQIQEDLSFEISIAYGAKPEARRALETEEDLFRRERGISRRKELSTLQNDEVWFRAHHENAINGWRGLHYRGKPVPYSLENLLRICLPGRKASDSCPGYLYRVRAAIMDGITTQMRIDVEAEAAVLGNSSRPSAGESGGDGSKPASVRQSSTDTTKV